jgi:superfamily II DNA or RNA helicase
MVSEGVDIPRLRVLIYATNITTRLFFRQAIGRVIRGPEPPAVVFLPADPLLLQFAAEIRQERLEALRKRRDDIDNDVERPERSTFLPRSSETFFDGVVHADGDVTQTEIDQAADELRSEGGHPTVELSTMLARILRRRGDAPAPRPVASAPPTADSPLLSERKKALKDACNKIVQAYCWETGEDYWRVNKRLNDAVGAKNIRACTEDQLRKRYDLAKRLMP